MSKVLRIILIVVWVVAASLALTRFVMTHPDYFPTLPESFAQWIIDLVGAGCCEEVAELEAGLVLLASLVLVSAVTWVTLYSARRRAS